MPHVGVGVAAVDKGEIDRRQPACVVVGEKLRTGHPMMGDDALDAEAAEARSHFERIAPLTGAPDRVEWPIGEHRIRWIGERETAGAVVLEAEREANDAEAGARSDDHDVPWTERADETVVDEAEPDVQRI